MNETAEQLRCFFDELCLVNQPGQSGFAKGILGHVFPVEEPLFLRVAGQVAVIIAVHHGRINAQHPPARPAKEC